MEPILNATPAQPPADAIKESNTANFVVDVMDASREAPVIVDFWAPWCGPCKQLGPALEQAVRAAGGAVRLVKINVDENPDLARQLQVMSIPAVYAFQDGRPVDGFIGAVPESKVKEFVSRLARLGGGSAGAEAVLDQARAALTAGDAATAGALYNQVLSQDPENTAAIAGLARCLVQAGEVGRAREVLDHVPAAQANDPEIVAARSAIDLAGHSGDAARIAELRARLERDANDHQARLDLANELYGAGQAEAAIDELIELVRRGRQWNDEAGRKQLLKLFEALGPTHPLTVAGRRRLSSVLFA